MLEREELQRWNKKHFPSFWKDCQLSEIVSTVDFSEYEILSKMIHQSNRQKTNSSFFAQVLRQDVRRFLR